MSCGTILCDLICGNLNPKEKQRGQKKYVKNKLLKLSKINEKYKLTDPRNSMNISKRCMKNTTQRHIVIKLLQTNEEKIFIFSSSFIEVQLTYSTICGKF